MSSHRKKIESQFNNKIQNNYSSFADDNENLDQLDFQEQDDQQYQSLLGKHKKKQIQTDYDTYNSKNFQAKKIKKNEIFNDQLTKKVSFQIDQQNDDNDDDETINSDDLSSDDLMKKNQNSSEEKIEESSQEKIQNIKTKKKIKKNDIDEIIQEMDDENQQQEQENQQIQHDQQKAQAIRNQLKIWKKLVQQQIQFEKPIQLLKQFPKEKYINDKQNIELQFKIINNLEKSVEVQKQLLQKTYDNEKVQNFQSLNFIESCKKQQNNIEQELNLQTIYEKLDENFQNQYLWLEDNILNWNQKTQILSKNIKKVGLGNILSTPIGQAQRAIQNPEKIIIKTQLKRGSYQVIGEIDNNRDFDENIYDDADFYQDLLKDYMCENPLVDDENNQMMNEDQRLLMQRKLKNFEKKAKKVDRKASKSRKIRYNIHPKLLNFMNPIDNNELFSGRDELIQKISNHKNLNQNQEQQKLDIKLF